MPTSTAAPSPSALQDVLIAGPVLILVSPVLAVVAVLIKIDSRGPVFFRQRRHGFNNEEIVVWKFRSMRADAADARAERQVTADDDRVTSVGRFLRKSSLDELPQLINVLQGEMSLVGPRPHAIGMKTAGVESAALVRPTPTGTGSSRASPAGRRSTAHAARSTPRPRCNDESLSTSTTSPARSFGLDLKIMAMTVPQLLGDRHVTR